MTFDPIDGPVLYVRRRGLILVETRKPGNDYGVLALHGRTSSGGQEFLTRRYFYEPLFNQQCAVIEEHGNPDSHKLIPSPLVQDWQWSSLWQHTQSTLHHRASAAIVMPWLDGIAPFPESRCLLTTLSMCL